MSRDLMSTTPTNGDDSPPAPDPLVLVFRDSHESPQKCSLTPLRGNADVRFVDYPRQGSVDAGGRILLHTDGEVLGPDDAGKGLLIVDSSWRRLPKLLRLVTGDPPRRRLPPLVTAYPRKSKRYEDPSEGLASVEALYAALFLLGHARPDLLEGYHWKEQFLELNPDFV